MKEVKLTLVEHTRGEADRTIAHVKATKHGKQAELRFIGRKEVLKFPHPKRSIGMAATQHLPQQPQHLLFKRRQHRNAKNTLTQRGRKPPRRTKCTPPQTTPYTTTN